MANDVASIGIGMETDGIDRGIKSLKTLAEQGPKVEKAFDSVEKTAVKTGKSLKTIGDGAGKGLDEVGRTAPKAADGLNRVVKSADEAKAAIAAIKQSAVNLGAVSSSAAQLTGSLSALVSPSKQAAQSIVGLASGAKGSQASLAEMQAQVRIATQSVQQMAAELGRTLPAMQAVTKAQEQAAKSAVEMGRVFEGVGARAQSYSSGVRGVTEANESFAATAALAARSVQAFLGLQVVGWGKDSAAALFEASAAAERLRIGLDFASTRGSAEEIAYLRKTTDDLGLAFRGTDQSYMQFQAAAKGTTLEGEKARAVFESVAKASAVMGLSVEQSSGVLLALQQMVSKGTAQAEELRGQLGERLPGAFQIAARSMGVTTAELGKMLEMGQVVSEDFLPKFAVELENSLGNAVENAANRLDASVNRMSNAWQRFMQTVGDSGISQAMANEAAGAANYLNTMSDAMDRAKVSGSGLVMQLNAGLGAAIMRLPLDALSVSANVLNGSINALTGNVFELNTNINLWNATQSTAAQRAQELERDLKNAEKALADLAARGAKNSSNLMLREAYDHAQRLVDKLREAKREKDALEGVPGGINPGDFPSRGSQANYLREREVASQKLLNISARESGITKQFLDDLSVYQEGLRTGVLSVAEYAAAVTKLNKARADATKKRETSTKPESSAFMRSEISAVKAAMEDLTSIYSGSESIIESLRRAGLVDEKEYYDAKISFVNLNIDAKKRELEEENRLLAAQSLRGDAAIERDRKISDNQSKINRLANDGVFQIANLGIQADAAANSQKASFEAAKQAAEDYLNTLQRGFARDVSAVGWGDVRRGIESGRQQIEDKYAGRRQDIVNQRVQAEIQAGGNLTAAAQKRFDDLLAMEDDYQSRALAKYEEGVAERLGAEGRWEKGVARAWENYAATAANMAQMSADAVTGAFKGMEDALVGFVMTGKTDFKSLANSIIADMIRIQARQALTGLWGSAMGSLPILGSIFGGGRATGGPVAAGKMYEVNERGEPELLTVGNKQMLMMSGQSGHVTPLSQPSFSAQYVRDSVRQGGGDTQVSVAVYIQQDGSARASVDTGSSGPSAHALGSLVGAAVKESLLREKRPGGVLWNMQQGRG